MGRAAALLDDDGSMMMQMYFTSALPVTVLFEGWVVEVRARERGTGDGRPAPLQRGAWLGAGRSLHAGCAARVQRA